jgi:hypothetical protein
MLSPFPGEQTDGSLYPCRVGTELYLPPDWADGLQRQFRFEAAPTVDPLEVQKLDRELAGRRIRLMKELRNAIGALEERNNTFQGDRAASRTKLEGAFNAWMLARHAAP